MTLSNPSGMNFTPAGAPIVLKRVADKIPQLGFIRPDAPDYEFYRQELEAVAPHVRLLCQRAATSRGSGSKARNPRRAAPLVTGYVKGSSQITAR
jgi:hypothetical protein